MSAFITIYFDVLGKRAKSKYVGKNLRINVMMGLISGYYFERTILKVVKPTTQLVSNNAKSR